MRIDIVHFKIGMKCYFLEKQVSFLFLILLFSVKGVLGRPGKIGPPGINGQPGMKGEQGSMGIRGHKGDKGDSDSPTVSAFNVYLTGGSAITITSGSQVITWDEEEFDIGDDMNHETGIYTCPVAGVYHFSFSIWSNFGYEMDIRLEVNGENQSRVKNAKGDRYMPQGAGTTLLLQAGDQVQLKAYSKTRIAKSNDKDNFFTGFLIHST